MPRFTPDPTPADRRREVARLLAAALLRHHRRVQRAVAAPPLESPDCLGNQLAERPGIRLNASTRAAGEGGDVTREAGAVYE